MRQLGVAFELFTAGNNAQFISQCVNTQISLCQGLSLHAPTGTGSEHVNLFFTDEKSHNQWIWFRFKL